MSDFMPVGNLTIEGREAPYSLVDEEGTVRAEGLCCKGHAEQFAQSGDVLAKYARLRERVRVLEEALRGLRFAAMRLSNRHHGGGKIHAEHWSDLYKECEGAQAALSGAEEVKP